LKFGFLPLLFDKTTCILDLFRRHQFLPSILQTKHHFLNLLLLNFRAADIFYHPAPRRFPPEWPFRTTGCHLHHGYPTGKGK